MTSICVLLVDGPAEGQKFILPDDWYTVEISDGFDKGVIRYQVCKCVLEDRLYKIGSIDPSKLNTHDVIQKIQSAGLQYQHCPSEKWPFNRASPSHTRQVQREQAAQRLQALGAMDCAPF